MTDVMTEAEFLGTDQKPQEALDGPPFIALTLTEGGTLFARAGQISAAWDIPATPGGRGAGFISGPAEGVEASHRVEVNDRIFYVKEPANEVMFLIQEALKAPVVFAEKESE